MKTTAYLLALCLAGTCFGAEAAADAKGARGAMRAMAVDKAPALDGVGRDGVWAKCPPLPLGECTSQKPGPLRTTARVLFDATHVYVSFDCADPDTDSLVRKAAERDGNVWADDSVEVFLSGDVRAGMHQFAVNPAGTLFDAKGRDAQWNSSAKAAAKVHAGEGWTVTLAIPMADVGGYVGENQTWIMNLNRTKPGPQPNRPAGEWSWAVMGSNDYHQVMDYGQVTGVSVPRRDDGVTRTATPPPPPPSYDKGGAAGSVTVYHRFGDVTIQAADGAIGRTFPLAIRNSDGLRLAFLARGEGVDSVPVNMADRRSNDNTTSKAYRVLDGGAWRPVVYFCDRFRYNAQVESTVGRVTDYTNIRFHGSAAPGGALHLRDLVIYRGEDTTPPPAPAKLAAQAGDDGVRLQWERVTDNTGVASYVIARAEKDGRFVKIAESPLPEYLDKPPATVEYRYRVLAVDFQDNLSAWSKPARARCSTAFPLTKATQPADDRLGYAGRIRGVHAAGAGKVKGGVVMAFGDSLTYATNYGTCMEAALGRYRVEAKGYPAKQTSFGRGRIEGDLAEVNPEFCLILLGTNNSKSDQAIEAAMADLLAMVASCEKRGTVAVVGTIPPRGFTDPASKPEARYNEAVVKTCRANQIPVAYLFELFQGQPDRRKLLAGDGVHWQGEGFPLTGTAWREVMDQVTFALLDRPE